MNSQKSKQKSKRDHEFYTDYTFQTEYVYREPKQLRHWLKKAGLKEDGKRKWNRQLPTSTWIGHGRRWRITCFGEFQVSCTNSDFDRWANSYAGVEFSLKDLDSETNTKQIIQQMLFEARLHDKESKDE